MVSTHIVCGIDPALATTGYGIIKDGRLIKAGRIRTSPDDPEPVRLIAIYRLLRELMTDHGVTEVALERFVSFYRRKDAREAGDPRRGRHDRIAVDPHAMFAMKAGQTAAQLATMDLGIPLFLYKENEWKGGRGINKEVVRDRAEAKYGVSTRDHNITDAIMIADHHYWTGRILSMPIVAPVAESFPVPTAPTAIKTRAPRSATTKP
jgi:Holliday junction resolvasome RuvABC endonuclease subunit